jgi:DNA-3-methyladenine glycosylase I
MNPNHETMTRCWSTKNPLYIKYHDEEWGFPLHDDKKLFEMLILEGFQAGLTWELILNRRQGLNQAFEGFDPQKVSEFNEQNITQLLANPQVIRNKLKIQAAINNAHKFLQIQEQSGSFDKYIWQFVNNEPITHNFKDWKEMPAQTPESQNMSKSLKKHGFKFVGPTICYAYMQAIGMVNDHLTTCFRHKQIKENPKL